MNSQFLKFRGRRKEMYALHHVDIFREEGPLGTMYTVWQAGNRLSSHGGGSDESAKMRAIAAADIAAKYTKARES